MQASGVTIGLPMPVPLLARPVRAGFPSPADDFIEDEIDIQRLLIANRPATFLVRVAGDSMVLARLFDGDLAVVDLFLALIVRLLKPDGRAAVVLPDGTLFGEGVKTRLKQHLMEECNLHTIVRLPNSVFKPYASIGTNLLFFEKGAPTKDIWFYEHRVPEGQKAYSMTKSIRLEHFQGCIDWWGGKERKGREETPQAWRVTAEEVKARGYNLDIKNPHSVAYDHGDPETLLADLAKAETETAGLRDQLKAILAEALAR